MQRVPCAIGNEPAHYRLADQREISKQVEHFMPDKLIRKAKGRVVEHAGLSQHDRILERAAANQAARLQHLDLVIETERSSRRDRISVVAARQFNLQALFPNQRMRKIDIVLDREFFRWIDTERLFAIFENELFGDTNILPRPFLLNNTGSSDGFCVRKRTSVQDRNLEVVE